MTVNCWQERPMVQATDFSYTEVSLENNKGNNKKIEAKTAAEN